MAEYRIVTKVVASVRVGWTCEIGYTKRRIGAVPYGTDLIQSIENQRGVLKEGHSMHPCR